MLATNVVVGRQAIQDAAGGILGFELLFRHTKGDVTAADLGSTRMTADVVFGALNIGLNHLVEGRLIFCNADRAVLTGELPLTLPPEQTVIEVLESVTIDDEVLAGCRRLRADGFRLALDDFTWFDGAERLLELADIVKIDIQAVPGAEVERLIARCRPHGVRLLAEKVETLAELERCRRLGFELFQGYLLERPAIVSGTTLEAGHAARLKMATMLLGSELEFEDLLELVRSDPGITYQILQLTSIGRPGETRRRVAGIRDALVLVGTRCVQNWMALLLARPQVPPASLRFVQVLIRARAVELLAARVGSPGQPEGFAAGMLSALDLLVGVPAAQLRAQLPLDDDLAEAAFGNQSGLAKVVQAARKYQLGNELSPDVVADRDLELAFAEAFAWAMQLQSALEPSDTNAA